MKYILFTTTSCPKCPVVKNFVAEKINFPGETLDNDSPNFAEKASEFKVDSAPTLIVLDDAENEIFRGNEASEIADFLASQN